DTVQADRLIKRRDSDAPSRHKQMVLCGELIMTVSEAKPKSNYTVKHIEIIAKRADVVARIFTLAPGHVIPWHYHFESNDHYFVLGGELSADTIDPDETNTLSVGERHAIKPGTKP